MLGWESCFFGGVFLPFPLSWGRRVPPSRASIVGLTVPQLRGPGLTTGVAERYWKGKMDAKPFHFVFRSLRASQEIPIGLSCPRTEFVRHSALTE